MDIQTASELLDIMPTDRSDYEFRNFVLDQHGSFARQLRAVLLEKEQLTVQLTELQCEVELLKLEATEEPCSAKRADIIARRNSSSIHQINRYIKGAEQKLAQCDAWLDEYDVDQLREVAAEFNDQESEHWPEYLGKHAAVEVLALNHSTKDTMMTMSQLPFSDFKKAVTLTAQLATFLKETTIQAESALFPNTDNMPSTAAADQQAS